MASTGVPSCRTAASSAASWRRTGQRSTVCRADGLRPRCDSGADTITASSGWPAVRSALVMEAAPPSL
ncbi:MAG: hypothetical protein R2749_23810 [Acidimicrobiales bacterium]